MIDKQQPIDSRNLVFGLKDLDKTSLNFAGGKAANLGELTKIPGIKVPDGFCISAKVFNHLVRASPEILKLIDQLSRLKASEGEEIAEISGQIRDAIRHTLIPEVISSHIDRYLATLGKDIPYAVRSSATAEDLPTASFAGQYDTYLNIAGKDAIVEHIRKCWASLYTERAVIYRIKNGIDHRHITAAVIVQRMVVPTAAGVMFTADPVSSNRKVLSIDATFGLGEALVSGLVNPDTYKVRNGAIIERNVGNKTVAISAAAGGGTETLDVNADIQLKQALTDQEVLQLERIGRMIEAHFRHPQDIEWCLADGTFYIVQSRPITTLFPVPEGGDHTNRVYVSVGHQQMMTDAIRPLGISIWQLTAARPMHTAGGRLFVDVGGDLKSAVRRDMLLNGLGKSDPLIRDALTTIIDRGDFITISKAPEKNENAGNPPPAFDIRTQLDFDPMLVHNLIKENEDAAEQLKRRIVTLSGPALLDFIHEDIGRLTKLLTDRRSMGVLVAAINASAWLNEKMEQWLGERNVADVISQSVSGNITSEMGLALLEIADVMRPHDEVVRFLETGNHANFPDGLDGLKGGQESRKAIEEFLNKYGVRCVGEIDITRPRWREEPASLIPILLSNIRNSAPGAAREKFTQGLNEASQKAQELFSRLSQLPDGNAKIEETRKNIELIRGYLGYREYPKYCQVTHYFIYKQALLREAGRLVNADVISEKADIFYLTFEELRHAVATQSVSHALINERKEIHRQHEKLNPPRVMTSDGEVLSGRYKRDNIPSGALVGLPVSSGIAEGRARVVLDIRNADFGSEDILVTSFTDPSWTASFLSIKGLVTEVGGLMTHGSVIAREYGLPAVVGVENATRLIRDGQRIRVNGSDGFIELLS